MKPSMKFWMIVGGGLLVCDGVLLSMGWAVGKMEGVSVLLLGIGVVGHALLCQGSEK